MKLTIMITGSSGFIGSQFIEKYKNYFNFKCVDLKKNAPEELNYNGVDCILHLAALVHQMNGASKDTYFKVNTELTKRLAIEAIKNNIKHFVFYSTVKVYGFDGDLLDHKKVLSVDSECKPADPYGASKYAAEEYLNSITDDNFILSVIRPPMVYGPMVKGNMINLVKLIDKFPILPFAYNNKRSMVYIDNLLVETKYIIDNTLKGVFIPQDLEALSIKEITEQIASSLGKKRIIIKFPNFIYAILCKYKKNIMVRLFGSLQFKRHNINNDTLNIDGITQMVKWYKNER